mmetsp:Transcript_102087/g.233857  ORF Transcript_102087/g.233857 Transcript_102087/m.233857 type:complete len:256 (-) Transcript_102087:237-1004(-)
MIMLNINCSGAHVAKCHPHSRSCGTSLYCPLPHLIPQQRMRTVRGPSSKALACSEADWPSAVRRRAASSFSLPASTAASSRPNWALWSQAWEVVMTSWMLRALVICPTVLCKLSLCPTTRPFFSTPNHTSTTSRSSSSSTFFAFSWAALTGLAARRSGHSSICLATDNPSAHGVSHCASNRSTSALASENRGRQSASRSAEHFLARSSRALQRVLLACCAWSACSCSSLVREYFWSSNSKATRQVNLSGTTSTTP